MYSNDLDKARQITAAVTQQFDNSSFAVAGGTVLSMREADGTERLHDDGVWQLTAKFAALVEPA